MLKRVSDVGSSWDNDGAHNRKASVINSARRQMQADQASDEWGLSERENQGDGSAVLQRCGERGYFKKFQRIDAHQGTGIVNRYTADILSRVRRARLGYGGLTCFRRIEFHIDSAEDAPLSVLAVTVRFKERAHLHFGVVLGTDSGD